MFLRIGTLALVVVSVFSGPAQADDGAASREAAVRSRAKFFSRVAVDKDYAVEHVVYRNKLVTAFLDLGDHRHPRYRGKPSTSTAIHLLVVPNSPREHIGKTLGAKISIDDLQATVKVVKAAQAVARRLGIKKASVYINSESRVHIGYLHVHVVGELPAARRLPKLQK
jgi:diadenosine tetraphosphate (Ap4A) HIT family hydrolase